MEEYIKKSELLKVLEGLYQSRKGKNCSRQVIIEAQIYNYVINIVKSIKTYEKPE